MDSIEDAFPTMAPATVESPSLLHLTAHVVGVVAHRLAMDAEHVPAFIREVHGVFAELANPKPQPSSIDVSADGALKHPPTKAPFVPVEESVFPDYIVCLEDGRRLKMLRRYLRTAYGMTPAEYRDRWGLPPTYPIVAPNYAQRRAELARESGLGKR